MDDFALTTGEDGAEIRLPPVLDIRAAAPLKEALAKGLAGPRATALNAAAVTRMSTPCIQVLIAGQSAFQAAGLPFKLVRPSDAFVEAFDDLGLYAVLKRWDIEG